MIGKIQHQPRFRQMTALIDEKSKRLDLLSAEKAEKRALMPPALDKPKSRNRHLRNLFGAR